MVWGLALRRYTEEGNESNSYFGRGEVDTIRSTQCLVISFAKTRQNLFALLF